MAFNPLQQNPIPRQYPFPAASYTFDDLSKAGAKWIHWRPGPLDIDFLIDPDEKIYLHDVRPSGGQPIVYSLETETELCLPLAQIRVEGDGSWYGTSERLVFSAPSQRLVYTGHKTWSENTDTHFMEVTMNDSTTKLEVRSRYVVFSGIQVLRSTVFVENKGSSKVSLATAASLSMGFLNRGTEEWWNEYEVVLGNNTNFREAQWKSFNLPDLGMDYVGESDFHKPGTRASVVKSSLGTFSTSTSLPMGALVKRDGNRSFLWQIEHSGAWRWELGNIIHGLYLVGGGPTEQDHQWIKDLAPGETFTSVSTALASVAGPFESTFAPITQYRRRIRRKHKDNEELPVIFNDYMNCLRGDPTEEKVEALIEPARKSGAEYFVIDAGWYADEADWWPTVGAWEPSTVRFPSGIMTVLDKIRSSGMIPGLWLEPEVVGVNSPAIKDLPDDAFFQRRGVRVIEQSRYQLDFRQSAVTSRLNLIIDNLVKNYGVGYFKFDYNIDVTSGTDVAASSPGDGMLEHRRAYMRWINGIYDRFPDLVLETCSSGAQRLDYDLLASHSIQSTSDQEDPILYSGISASIATAITPEQSASWAFPQPYYSDELISFTVMNSLLGRVHLSGRIDLLGDRQLDIVADGIAAYKKIRHDIKSSLPFWPLGMPCWNKEWLVLGLSAGPNIYLGIWRRGGSEHCVIPIPEYQNRTVNAQVLYPTAVPTTADWVQTGALKVTLPASPSARLVCLSYNGGGSI